MTMTEACRKVERSRRVLLLGAAALLLAATMLPLWGMTLVSTQYPDGLRMVVYPHRIVGDISEINALNHYIGMPPISDGFFVELRFLRPALVAAAALAVVAAFVRIRWAAVLPLALLVLLAAGGLGAMRYRLWQFGHQLDPQAPITIEPFTPPMIGFHQIAQFATFSYFSWGVFLPAVAGLLVAAVALADRRARLAPAHS